VAREHVLDGSTTHHDWDRGLEPALEIQSGDVVHVSPPFAGDPSMTETSTVDELDVSRFRYRLVGPIVVAGAEPGHTLEVEILRVRPASWGHTIILPGYGLLPEEFPEAYLKIWDLADGERATLVPGVSVALSPFLGTMGTHPGEPSVADPLPPHRGGGNIDNRHLTAGSRLWLPVWCEGALFSCGDGHAAQGDGEVCVSAIECSVDASLRFRLHRRPLDRPRFAVPTPAARPDASGYQGTMGISDDLMEGARQAVRAMIAWLVDEHRLTSEDAYVLCSVAGDLKLLEVVDAGVWNVAMTLPLASFERPPADQS
jgi:acetamidase/formamidase